MKGLYYNHMAPKIAYTFAENKALTFLFNLGRVLTLHPPLRQGQFQSLMTMKQLTYGDSFAQLISGYSNPLVSNVVKALHSIPEFLPPLKRAFRRSSWTGNVPERVHTAVAVFPVYCEMLPEPVKFFFAKLEAKYVALIAIYGKIGKAL